MAVKPKAPPCPLSTPRSNLLPLPCVLALASTAEPSPDPQRHPPLHRRNRTHRQRQAAPARQRDPPHGSGFLVALLLVRDLLLCAKHLFVEAMVAIVPARAGQR